MLTVGSNIAFYSCWRCNLQLSLQEFNYDVFHYKQFVINSNYKQTFIAILPLSNPPISYSEPHAAHLHCSFETHVDTEEDIQLIPLENQSIIYCYVKKSLGWCKDTSRLRGCGGHSCWRFGTLTADQWRWVPRQYKKAGFKKI